MNQINRTFRNLAGLIILIVLAAAVFWLVSSQADSTSQLTAQSPDPTDSPTVSTPPAAATPEPTNPPFTPEEVIGKVTIITVTAPQPTPTIGPGSLAAYRLSEPIYIPLGQNDQTLNFLGLSDDGNTILTYSLPGNATQPVTLNDLSIKGDLSEQAIESYPLAVEATKLQYTPGYPAIQLLGQTDHVIYRETLNDNLFNLKISDKQGQNLHTVAQATSPKFTTSNEGVFAYVNQDKIVVYDSLQDTVLTQFSASTYDIDVFHEYFGLSLSPQATHLAIYDNKVFKMIDLKILQAITMPVSFGEQVKDKNYEVPEGVGLSFVAGSILWSPNGQQIQFSLLPVVPLGNVPASHYIMDIDGQNERRIDYAVGIDGYPVYLTLTKWLTDDLLAGMATPYLCENNCKEKIILVSSSGKQVYEIIEQTGVYLFGGTNSALVYNCKQDKSQESICISTLSK